MRWILVMLLLAGCGGSSPTAPRDSDGDGYEVDVDCCDDDDRVFPGQTLYFEYPSNEGSFDYNCDGIEEMEWAELHECYEGNDLCELRLGGWQDYVPVCRGVGYWVSDCGTGHNCRATNSRKIQACH